MGVEEVLPHAGEREWIGLSLKTSPPSEMVRCSEWPARMKGELCWDRMSFSSEDDFTLTLSNDERMEVRMALRYFNGR